MCDGHAVVPVRDTIYMLFCLLDGVHASCKCVVHDQVQNRLRKVTQSGWRAKLELHKKRLSNLLREKNVKKMKSMEYFTPVTGEAGGGGRGVLICRLLQSFDRSYS